MTIRTMDIEDFENIYDLWIHTEGMRLNTTDDSREEIAKLALVVFEKNVSGNIFWEKVRFTVRDDLVYRNRNIHELKRIDLI